jgi:hypothetical protein
MQVWVQPKHMRMNAQAFWPVCVFTHAQKPMLMLRIRFAMHLIRSLRRH